MYLVEKDIQPDKFGSIPQSMWWALVTLTTVGYGDVYPITPLGKMFGSISIILGIGTVALPAGIMASAFTEFTRRNQKTYEDKLKFMLKDDIIDKDERAELKILSEKLNLTDKDIGAIEEHLKSKNKFSSQRLLMKCVIPLLTLLAHSYKASNFWKIAFFLSSVIDIALTNVIRLIRKTSIRSLDFSCWKNFSKC